MNVWLSIVNFMQTIHAANIQGQGIQMQARNIIPVDEEVPTEGIDCELQPELCEENIVETPEEEELTEEIETEEIETEDIEEGRGGRRGIRARAKAVKNQAEVKKKPPNKKQSFLFFHLLFSSFTIKK